MSFAEKINLELHRKDIKEMRWEEIWDISLRIQNIFLGGVFPEEDSQARSFAGLHESYLNVVGLDELLKKIKKVWASLWSDRAILQGRNWLMNSGEEQLFITIG